MIKMYETRREIPPAPVTNTPGLCPARYSPSDDEWDFMCCDLAPHDDGRHHDPEDGWWWVTFTT
jgi:hypothetical protein